MNARDIYGASGAKYRKAALAHNIDGVNEVGQGRRK